jgi:hypothetical protein
MDRSVQPAPCRYFSREGGCRNGAACPFRHEADSAALEAVRTASRVKGARTWAFVPLGPTLASVTTFLEQIPDEWLWHHPRGGQGGKVAPAKWYVLRSLGVVCCWVGVRFGVVVGGGVLGRISETDILFARYSPTC